MRFPLLCTFKVSVLRQAAATPLQCSTGVASALAGLPHEEGRVGEVLEQGVVAPGRRGLRDAREALHEVLALHGARVHACTTTKIPS